MYAYATPKKDMEDIGYQLGVRKSVRVLQMLCGRFQIFKHLNHFGVKAGHKVYNTIQDMEIDFELERDLVY